jgi:hypothetical protein
MKRWLPVAGIVALGAVMAWRVSGCDPAHNRAFSDEGLVVASADSLRTTTVTPHMEAPIAPGLTVLWCGTFQLVWNEICTLIGEDLHFTADPPMVAAMNRKAFTRGDLDEASYVAVAGFIRDGIKERIPRALEERFHGAARPSALPPWDRTPRPQDIVGYAYLFKLLEFPNRFERLDDPLDFAGARVAAFGLGPYKSAQSRMLPQVRIHDYAGPDDFVIELETKATKDSLVLAKVAPAATLAETAAAALARLRPEPPTAAPGDLLAVPLVNFDVTRAYSELYSPSGGPPLRVVAANPQVAKDLEVLSAVQNIRFQMDEEGVRLKSDSHMSIGCMARTAAPVAHLLIFDKPFLILMKRQGAAAPYFALWMGSAELMVKAASAAEAK